MLKTGILAISSVEGELLGALPPPQKKKKKVFLETFPRYGLVGGFTDLGKFSKQRAFFVGGASLIMCDRRDIDTIRHIGRAVRFV